MNTSLSLDQITLAVSRFLHRYHVMIFILTVIGGLAVATFILYNTYMASTRQEVATPRPTFDTQTIDKIKSFKTTEENKGDYKLPAGRTNPFE